MTAIFLSFAALLTLTALVLLVLPLLRAHAGETQRGIKQIREELALLKARRDAGKLDEAGYEQQRRTLSEELLAVMETPENRNSGARGVMFALLVLVPCSVAISYMLLGEPRALDAQQRSLPSIPMPTGSGELDAPEMNAAIDTLARRMRDEPDNLEGWVLLARAYYATERFEQARDAFSEALRLAPQEPNLIIEFAEALALASPGRRLAGEPQQLLQRALELEPSNQRGLWMMGVAAQQQGDHAAAERWWTQLLNALPADAPIRDTVSRQIDTARQMASSEQGTVMPPLAAVAEPSAPEQAAMANGPRLQVHVELDPALASQVPPGAVLFVFARAAEGPRMPLAIQRLPASSLPVSVVLDDSQSMVEGMKLSTMPSVVVGARISLSGDATPASGDLEGLSPAISNSHQQPLTLRIDRVIP